MTLLLALLAACGTPPGGDCYPVELDIQFVHDPEACYPDPEEPEVDGCCPDGFEALGFSDPSTVVCLPAGCA